MKNLLVLGVVMLLPVVAFAQTGYSIQGFITNLGTFLNDVIVPFILAIAFLIFIFNVVRFFIIQSHEEEGRKNAKNLAIYSIGTFVFLLSLWGIVNLFVAGIGLQTRAGWHSIPDYIRDKEATDFENLWPVDPMGGAGPARDPWEGVDPMGGIPGDIWGGVDPMGGGNNPPPPPPQQPGQQANPPGGVDAIATQAIQAEVAAREAEIRTATADTVDKLREKLGPFHASARDWLFSPLLREDEFSDYDDLTKLRAAYATWRLDGITETEMNNYLTKTNELRQSRGQETITSSQLQDFPPPSFLPVQFSIEQDNLKEEIKEEIQNSLTSFNSLSTDGSLTASEVEAYAERLTDARIPYEQRLEALDELYGNNDDGIIYLRDPNNPSQANYDIEYQLLESMNAQKLITGDFDLY